MELTELQSLAKLHRIKYAGIERNELENSLVVYYGNNSDKWETDLVAIKAETETVKTSPTVADTEQGEDDANYTDPTAENFKGFKDVKGGIPNKVYNHNDLCPGYFYYEHLALIWDPTKSKPQVSDSPTKDELREYKEEMFNLNNYIQKVIKVVSIQERDARMLNLDDTPIENRAIENFTTYYKKLY